MVVTRQTKRLCNRVWSMSLLRQPSEMQSVAQSSCIQVIPALHVANEKSVRIIWNVPIGFSPYGEE